MRPLVAIMCFWASVAAAQEDAAHRSDRLRTQQLNRDAAAAAAKRDQRSHQIHDRARADYNAAQKRYEKAMSTWRRRVAACQDGDYASCDNH